jgi:polyhydroxyalkanoate synthesis repressor PhaR
MMTTSVYAALQHQLEYSIHWTFCQRIANIICTAQRRCSGKTAKDRDLKYANRRLYDTSGSRYINLEDIAALVRNGKDLQVVDAKTGEDLTRVTLAQIIVEDARGQPTGLPLELLRQLIVASDRVGQEFIMWYLKSAFDAYQKMQSSVQSRISEVQSATLSPLLLVKSLMKRSPKETPSEPAEELQELRNRISELEGRLQERKRRKTGGTPRVGYSYVGSMAHHLGAKLN